MEINCKSCEHKPVCKISFADYDVCENYYPSSRTSIDEYYLGIARAVSRRSTCLRRQYGAVIVKNDEIIATGYNGPPRGEEHCQKCSRTGHEHGDGNYDGCNSVHAEMNAIISAARRDMIGSTLYLAGFDNGEEIIAEPCPVCWRMIKNAGIKKVKMKSAQEKR